MIWFHCGPQIIIKENIFLLKKIRNFYPPLITSFVYNFCNSIKRRWPQICHQNNTRCTEQCLGTWSIIIRHEGMTSPGDWRYKNYNLLMRHICWLKMIEDDLWGPGSKCFILNAFNFHIRYVLLICLERPAIVVVSWTLCSRGVWRTPKIR